MIAHTPCPIYASSMFHAECFLPNVPHRSLGLTCSSGHIGSNMFDNVKIYSTLHWVRGTRILGASVQVFLLICLWRACHRAACETAQRRVARRATAQCRAWLAVQGRSVLIQGSAPLSYHLYQMAHKLPGSGPAICRNTAIITFCSFILWIEIGSNALGAQ